MSASLASLETVAPGTAPGLAAPLAPIGEWRLHLGAHKTATTHIQQTLETIRDDLAVRNGVDALPMLPFRTAWEQRMAAQKRRRSWRTALLLLGRPLPARHPSGLEAAIAPLRIGPSRVLISEENLLGQLTRTVGVEVPYVSRRTEFRLRLLKVLLGRSAPVHLFFCIRDMGDFLPSAYVQALKHFRIRRPFETAMAAALADPPSWLPVVAMLERSFPGVPLTVWRYEAYRDNSREIVGWLAGADPGPLPAIPKPTGTATPSEQAVREVEAMDDLDTLGRAAREKRVGRTYNAHPATAAAPAFRPIPPDIAARCAARYAQDCAALAARGLLRDPATGIASRGEAAGPARAGVAIDAKTSAPHTLRCR